MHHSHLAAKTDDGLVCNSVVNSLRRLYDKHVRSIENTYLFSRFHSPPLDAADFTAKPMILLLGQYSTGKTTFIRYLMNADFPGMRIGPEPTTDKFCIVMEGDESVIPGNALVVDAQKPFRPLSQFGNTFLNRLQCCTTHNPVLESVTIIDTPGILSGEKQRTDRGYDFTRVIAWFAQVVHCIILLFDAHKLDISDEFRKVIEALKDYDEKICIVLNKADTIDQQQLMRVYGALMWNLGKVFGTPEVVRVYIGSFWDKPLQYDHSRRLFELEEEALLKTIKSFPSNAAIRKINDVIRRIRLLRVHVYIISYLKKEMPSLIGKKKKQKELTQNLHDVYCVLSRQYNIPLNDFPDAIKMQAVLDDMDISKFPSLKTKLLEHLDLILSKEIPQLLESIPQEQLDIIKEGRAFVKGGVFDNDMKDNPFVHKQYPSIKFDDGHNGWIVDKYRKEWDEYFVTHMKNGVIMTDAARNYMMTSKLPINVLKQVWNLSDVDKDGHLSKNEFALANYLIQLKLNGEDLPSILPHELLPPGDTSQ